MKKIFSLLLLCLLGQQLLAQTKTDSLNKLTQKAIGDNDYNGKGNDRALFPVFLNSFINLLGTDGKNNIVINPTLYSLFSKDTKLTDIQKYRSETFRRNVSLLFGVSPDTKNQLHVDGVLWGAKWIIKNNKILHEKDYQKVSRTTLKLVDSVNQFASGLPGGRNVVRKYLQSTDSVNQLAKDTGAQVISIRQQVEKRFHVSAARAADLINGSFALMGALKEAIQTQSALSFTYNQTYDFQKSQTNQLLLSADYSFFIGTIPFDLGGSFTLGADSAQKHSGLVRKIAEITFGKNITFKKAKWLEIKPAVDYIHTLGPLYKKEKTDSFAASITPRFMINKNFWLPFTVKYDTKGFLGLLSVQYALK